MEFSVYGVALIPLVTAIVEMVKSLGMSKRYSMIVALLMGVVFGVFYIAPYDLKAGVIAGLVLGLSASGFYSGAKQITKRKPKEG
ncbi:hypothetical protein GLW04_19445 [Halobacillus litoralis]|uniref:Holin n=1 Tax=Halobacillus litoralis TaxID=45668 RepID=A0A845DWH3_9BACI|nr:MULTISPECIES: hypothetical protein [Halobacillus]MYL22053.1 hypothetical protein [Halobacillus litoralis]MYL31962.1 hypothetical protein [Halobacillus halophilus]MYL39972.1 hypothetical protein [Halobacillus litoralis]